MCLSRQEIARRVELQAVCAQLQERVSNRFQETGMQQAELVSAYDADKARLRATLAQKENQLSMVTTRPRSFLCGLCAHITHRMAPVHRHKAMTSKKEIQV